MIQHRFACVYRCHGISNSSQIDSKRVFASPLLMSLISILVLKKISSAWPLTVARRRSDQNLRNQFCNDLQRIPYTVK